MLKIIVKKLMQWLRSNLIILLQPVESLSTSLKHVIIIFNVIL